MDRTLDLDSRRRIYDLIRSRPGTYLREMERELGMQVGMLTYHLRVLTEAGLVRTEGEGTRLCYFPMEGFILADRKMLSYLRNRSTRDVLMYALDRGVITFTELRSALGVSKSTLSYHLKRLNAAGMVVINKAGEMTIQVADPEKLASLLVWVGDDVEKDSADALIDIWKRMRDR